MENKKTSSLMEMIENNIEKLGNPSELVEMFSHVKTIDSIVLSLHDKIFAVEMEKKDTKNTHEFYERAAIILKDEIIENEEVILSAYEFLKNYEKNNRNKFEKDDSKYGVLSKLMYSLLNNSIMTIESCVTGIGVITGNNEMSIINLKEFCSKMKLTCVIPSATPKAE